MKIEIDSEKLRSVGKVLQDESQNIENEIKKLENEIEKISNSWHGTDANSFVNLAQEVLVSNLNKLKEIINTYGYDLDVIGNSYDALDDTYASKNIEV